MKKLYNEMENIMSEYRVILEFDCNGNDMVVVKKHGATSVMSREDWMKLYGRLHPGRWNKSKK